MGTQGYTRAADLIYEPGEIILEVGSGESTEFLSTIGPRVVTVDMSFDDFYQADRLPNVEAHLNYAALALQGWNRPIGFAWLDGHDWPYTGNPPEYYQTQRAEYEARNQEYSQEASRRSHLEIARLIADHARVIAFDDTWRTHHFVSTQHPMRGARPSCLAPVPPATLPAAQLAMDTPLGGLDGPYGPPSPPVICGLERDHPHHAFPDHPEDPGRGWNGKGGDAIPYLLTKGFKVTEYKLCLVILAKG